MASGKSSVAHNLNSEAQSFLDDLEKAKALSLETLELDRIRREHLVQEELKHLVIQDVLPSHCFSSKQSNNLQHCYETLINVQKTTSVSSSSKTVHAEPRRPLVKNVPHSDPCLPPPPRRQPTGIHTQLEDLIVFSPIEKEKKEPLEELEDAIRLSSTSSQCLSSNINSESLFKTNSANITPNYIVSSLSSSSNDKKLTLGTTVASKEISHVVSSAGWCNSPSGTISSLPLFGTAVFQTFPENHTVPLFSPPVPQRSIGSFSFPNSPVTSSMFGIASNSSNNLREFSKCGPPFHSSNQNLQRLFSSSPVVPSSSPVLDQSLSVLKIMEKKRNSNLIDLADTEEILKMASASSCALTNQTSDNSNKDDLLSSFDPLLTSSKPAHLSVHTNVNMNSSRVISNSSTQSSSQIVSAFEDNFDPIKHIPEEYKKTSDLFTERNGSKISENEESPPPPPVPPRPKAMVPDTIIDGVNVPVRNKRFPSRPASNRHGDIFDLNSSESGNYLSLKNKQRRQSRTYETIRVQKGKLESNSELEVFCQKIIKLRSEFLCGDYHTNVGLVISPTLESLREESTSVKLVINSSLTDKPILFTCDVTTTVEHIISHVICTIFDDISDIDFKKFVLKVYGLAEYFAADSCLHDYEYVHHCQKYDEDVQLTLIKIEDLKRPLARTALDDKNDVDIKPEDLLEMEIQNAVPYETIAILLETFEREVEKMREQALKTNAEVLQSQGVVQAVKAICAILSQVEMAEITEAVEGLIHVSLQFGKMKSDEIVTGFSLSEESARSDNETLTIVELTKKLPNTPNIRMELLQVALERVNQAVRDLLDIYCRSFYVDFHIPRESTSSAKPVKEVSCIVDTLLVQISAVHRLPMWCSNYESFVIGCELYYGTHLLCDGVETKPSKIFISFHEQLIFDEWLLFPTVLLCTLPRESRLVFTLYGLKTISSEAKTPDAGQVQRTPLGWSAIKLFQDDGMMQQGSYLCGLWPEDGSKIFGLVISNSQSSYPILQINLPDYGCNLVFPSVVKDYPCQRREFESLDVACQQELLNIIERSSVAEISMEEKEFLWEKRHCLYDIPQALPRVLQAAHSWDWACLADIYSMLREWKALNPIDALELLLPSFPDLEVRKTAISWIKNLGSDELCDYLPQLVQALKFEMWDNSPTAMFLLERSLTSIRVAHHLYWLLKQNLDDKRCSQRIHLILNAMLSISGRAMRTRFENQEELMKNLAIAANKIKNIKDSLRLTSLFHELESIHYMLSDNLTSLPLSPSLEVAGLEVKMCSYFTSNTLPLKLSFKSAELGTNPIEAIFKVGDDLRQDTLTIQMIRIMDKLWLKEGLDLRIVTFSCVATGYKEGIVEMVKSSETLRKIQTEHGLTGSFKDRPISEWLQKHNPSELEYQQAVENFTYSCAGYSVATYILGICDRHNDNIMLKTSGHLFHIDFGKFLGDAQMFGGIKRDRVPFVLTSDMAYVINGGDKPSSKFQHFVELCCQAFNIIRKHGNLFLNLFQLMSASGIPGVTSEAVSYINRALLPEISDAESAAVFARMIEESLKSWFTQFNFFIHNLAQLRFTGDHNDGTLLTFIPKTYTMETEGKIKSLEIIGYQKRYDPEKYYVYILKVEREGQPDPTILFRSYREVCELQQKLCTRFPLAKYRYHSLPKSVSLGRSNIRQVAEKRKSEIESFLQSLWNMADEIKHCDLIYTFCHPLLRDQQEGIAHLQKVKEPRDRNPHCAGLIHGQVKLSMRFHENTFFVMVMHARNLNSSKNADPDPYVKIYLIPDPNKITKRKTKVIRKNCHPTFMEMLHYRFPLDVIRQKTLQVSVWDYDRMAENTFLGAVSIPLNTMDLSSETTSWYSLGNLYR